MMKTHLLSVIQEAGALILQRQQTDFKIEHKEGVNNLVTEVDREAELLIRKRILDKYPDHGIIGEEFDHVQASAKIKWIVDPIDGTVNYAHGIPFCCVSIGIMENDILILGAVFNPFLNELFFAEKGKGAYLNNKSIKVSTNAQFETAFLVTGFPYRNDQGDSLLQPLHNFIREGLSIRRLGSAAIDLCYVACGRFDGFWEVKLNPWDVAAGCLILEEAGGKITDFNSQNYTIFDQQILATNRILHEQIRKHIL